MASNIPIVRQVGWLSVIPQLLLITLLILFYHFIGSERAMLLGALTFLVITFGLRYIVAIKHRKGIRLTKQHKFAEAIPYFQQSVEFFSKHNWVDKYRYLTLMSSSKMTYKELAFCNIAFCYCQIGEGLKAKEYYQLTLKEYPENGMAIAALKMLNSMDQHAEK
jgi:tetratricopeptide (TPR) repeat protein